MVVAERMSARVAAVLRHEIVAGQLKPGTPLRIHQVAARFEVSTTPAREALAALEREGLALGKMNHGLRVAKLTPRDLADAYGLHAYMVRVVTERAVAVLTDSQIDELEAVNQEIAVVTRQGDLTRAAELNHAFHRKINRAGTSAILRRFLLETTPYVTRRTDPLVPGWSDQPLEEHGSILSALRARNGGRAAALMERHILHSGELVILYGEQDASDMGDSLSSA